MMTIFKKIMFFSLTYIFMSTHGMENKEDSEKILQKIGVIENLPEIKINTLGTSYSGGLQVINNNNVYDVQENTKDSTMVYIQNNKIYSDEEQICSSPNGQFSLKKYSQKNKFFKKKYYQMDIVNTTEGRSILTLPMKIKNDDDTLYSLNNAGTLIIKAEKTNDKSIITLYDVKKFEDIATPSKNLFTSLTRTIKNATAILNSKRLVAPKKVSCITFANNNAILALGHDDGNFSLCKSHNNELLCGIITTNLEDTVRDIKFSTNDATVITLTKKNLSIFDTITGNLTHSIATDKHPFKSLYIGNPYLKDLTYPVIIALSHTTNEKNEEEESQLTIFTLSNLVYKEKIDVIENSNNDTENIKE